MSKILWDYDLDDLLYREEYQYKLYDDYVLNADTPEVLTFDAWLDEIFYEESHEEYLRELEDHLEDELEFDIMPDIWNQANSLLGIVLLRNNADWYGDVNIFLHPEDLENYLLSNKNACLMVDDNGQIYEAFEDEYFYTFPSDYKSTLRIIRKCTTIWDDLKEELESSYGEEFTKEMILLSFKDSLEENDTSIFTDVGVEKLAFYLKPILYKD